MVVMTKHKFWENERTPVCLSDTESERSWKKDALETTVRDIFGDMEKVKSETRDGDPVLRVYLHPECEYNAEQFWQALETEIDKRYQENQEGKQ